MKIFKQNRILTCLFTLTCQQLTCSAEFNWDDYYTIENIPVHNTIDPQIGGLDFNANGELVACFHRGEVAVYNEESKQWRIIASGLHEPLGLYVEPEGTILVIQRAELTRLHDKDKDGLIDFYEVVCNDWGLSGNYHEFSFGIVKDSKKNIYISLGTASNGSGAREEIRGEWSDIGGLTHEKFLYGGKHGEWRSKRRKMPRMYARVPYRGCILKIEPDSMKAKVFATGVRTPNGLYIDSNDQLWVTDNQGDWVGSSKIHMIEEGGFHGHPASLLWAENPPSAIPSKIPAKKLDAMRIKAAALLPQGDCSNSVTQIRAFENAFTPVKKDLKDSGQLLLGEMNHSRLVRYIPDVVNGKQQGAATHFLSTKSLNHGNNRLIFSADKKSLYLGKTHLSWPGRKGVRKVNYTGKPYLIADSVKLTPKGFVFEFNTEIEASAAAEDYKIESYGIDYHAKYGSKKIGVIQEHVAQAVVKGNTLTIDLTEKPKANKVYDIQLPKSITSELSDISSSRYWYTAHEVYQ